MMPTLDFYNRYYAVVEASSAHNRLCTLVYGLNLCQHGMADIAQIDTLLRRLNLKHTDHLLDLGCGNGYITEYMQATTGATVTGVDLSPVAIERAALRTSRSSGRLTFQVADMRNLKYPPDSFEAIVLIDSHYFVDDLEALIESLMGILTEGGLIGLFSDQGTGIPGRDDSQLDPSESIIGQLLMKRGIPYEAVNLTKQNQAHWKLKETVLLQLKTAFEREGNMFLYENRINECRSSNRDLDCRFLFIMHKIGGTTK